ncbi:MAG: orotidine-5'-phosphate decarboxylase [Micrococcales bacterium]|nr:orotidine-5'-phosphate decarboxylase [Micrococcales bacterium]
MLDLCRNTQPIERQPLPDTFSRKLESAFAAYGQLCVGIDPHPELLEEQGLVQSPEGLYAFSMQMLEGISGVVGIVKPQVSFFERFGSEGFAVLERVLSEANRAGLLVIADAKRGDIGTTMAAYADAWLAKDAPFICDALTVNPYLGVGALLPAVTAAVERGKGLFVLAATSNPEALGLQSAKTVELTVAKAIADQVSSLNHQIAQSKSVFGSIGLVLGATVDLDSFGLANTNVGSAQQRTPILAPGFGAQGARLADAKNIFDKDSDSVLYSISRSALRNGLQNLTRTLENDKEELLQALTK